LPEPDVRRRADRLYQQLDHLTPASAEELLAESHNHPASKLLCEVPSVGPIRVALVIALLQTPHRFRTKRQLWAYSGLALETRVTGEYRFAAGELQRSKKRATPQGLNENHNHDLKNVFKAAATRASTSAGLSKTFTLGCWPNR
jgi:hypothetical protein